MTITLTKTKLAMAIVVAALLVPATAFANHVFDDVPDDKFYADPVEWAFDNNITTGKSPTSFAPEDNVTRGESVTFLKRYNDNIVEPADEANASAAAAAAAAADAAQTDADANGEKINDNASDIAALPVMHSATLNADGTIYAASSGVNTDVAETKRISTGTYEVDFAVSDTAECQAIASISHTGDKLSGDLPGDSIDVLGRFDDESSVWVNVRDNADAEIDSPFTIQLWCYPAGIDITPLSLLAESAATGAQS